MNFENPLFLIPILTGPIMFVAGWILKKYPPKKINEFYGYRTKNSKKNQERWDFAQQYSAKEMMFQGAMVSLSCILGVFMEPRAGIGVVIGLGIMIFAFIILMLRTERAIKTRFKD
ncbi:SdpI family protein [Spongiimicrobium salis]|uniref:SdpI family protein n=1 Tax=Spongiimicrobium salis TaxID=1667022 RepID=UPI00374CE3E0